MIKISLPSLSTPHLALSPSLPTADPNSLDGPASDTGHPLSVSQSGARCARSCLWGMPGQRGSSSRVCSGSVVCHSQKFPLLVVKTMEIVENGNFGNFTKFTDLETLVHFPAGSSEECSATTNETDPTEDHAFYRICYRRVNLEENIMYIIFCSRIRSKTRVTTAETQSKPNRRPIMCISKMLLSYLFYILLNISIILSILKLF